MTKHIKIWALLICLFVIIASFAACNKADTETETPTTEAPTTEAPTTEAPTTDEPTTDEPTTDEPTECAHTGGTATCTEKATCETCGEQYGELAPDNHTGGTATCNAKATCTACGEQYGELAPANHAGEASTYTQTETTHKSTYDCCGAVKVAEEAHEWTNGVCSECGYGCTHTGGEATCTAKAICSACNVAYGELDPDNHTTEGEWVKTSLTHKMTYSCCDTVGVEVENHEWADGVCSECGYTCAHKGGTATCTDKAVCSVCGTSYGNVNANNHAGEAVWTKTATTHKQTYNCCNKVAVEEEAHNWNNGVCDDCVYLCAHTGGTATCTSRATCEICSKMYGKINAENHSGEPVWTKTSTTHTKTYNCCGTHTVATEAHEWTNGKCTECGLVCAHTVGVEATCSALAVCGWCGESFGELAPDNHKEAIAATCLEKAVCEWCEHSYGEINPDNHAGQPKWTTTETTHKVEYSCCGFETQGEELHNWANGVCVDCEYECGHDYKAVVTDPTCTADGYTTHTCTICAHAYTDTIVTALGHTGGSASCTEPGKCTVCGAPYVDAKGHSYESTVVDPTCTANGYTKHVCSVCGYTYTDTPVDAIPHTGGTATCIAQAKCDVCGTSYGDKNAANHTSTEFNIVYVNNTTHYYRYKCCNDVAKGENHSFNNDVCVCGFEDPTMLNANFISNSATAATITSAAKSENGFNYTHLTLSGSNPTINIFDGNKSYNRYMLVRYRGNGSGYGNGYDFFLTVNGTKLTGGGKNKANWFNLNLNNQWHYIIIDLGTSNITSLTWTLADGTITEAKGNWFDIEYVKFFGSYADAKAFEVARHPDGNIYPGIAENGSNGAVTGGNVPITQVYYATNANGFASGAPVAVPSSGNHLTMDWGFVTANGGYKLIVTVGLSGTYSAADIGIQIGDKDIEWGVNIQPQAGIYWCFANIADRVSLNQTNTLRVYLRNRSATIAEESYLLLANYTIEIVG